MKKKIRILERKYPSGMIKFVIQLKHWLFRGQWVDAWVNFNDETPWEFDTLKEAEEHLWQFDGSKSTDKIIKEIN